MSSLSVVVITRNEERNIRECLESAQWAGEIVVVDAGSTDRTVEIAREFTNKVFVRSWEGFGQARNYAVTQSSSEWIFWLDADERITTRLAEEIRQAMNANDSLQGYSVPRKSLFLGRWMKHGGWYPGRVVRLFRRDAGLFTDHKVHERLDLKGSVGELREDLLHKTDPTLEHYFEKFNRYTSLAAEELEHQGNGFKLTHLLVRPVWTFVRMYVVRSGFRDGIEGLILSVLSASYVFTKYAKLWERKKNGNARREHL